MSQPRHPQGAPAATGGQYTTTTRGEATIRLEDLARCGTCSGTGRLHARTCPACTGAGVLDEDGWNRHVDVEAQASVPCDACDDGITAELAICGTCDGAGSVRDYSLV